MSGRHSPNDMDTDNLEKQAFMHGKGLDSHYYDDPDNITTKMHEGAEPQYEYSEAEWNDWKTHLGRTWPRSTSSAQKGKRAEQLGHRG